MRSRSTTDVVAISLSGLCLLHCLALPMIVSLSPIFGLASEEWVHGVLAIAASLVSVTAFLGIASDQNRAAFTGFAIAGMALLLSAAFLEALHDYETPMTVLGAGLLAIAHTIRWRAHT